jgi:hypothetical protein
VGFVLDPRFRLLLDQIQFEAEPLPVADHPDLTLHVLDLRVGEIPQWASRITGIGAEKTQRCLDSLTPADMRTLLTYCANPHKAGDPPAIGGYQLTCEEWRQLLMAKLDELARVTGREETAELIRASYLRWNGETRLAMADRFHLSRATFHRHLARAVDEFTAFVSAGSQAELPD